jgi:hypothetical protein
VDVLLVGGVEIVVDDVGVQVRFPCPQVVDGLACAADRATGGFAGLAVTL